MQSKLQPTRAFTKLELIVIIAVIAIIAALLLPALARNRQKSQRIQCISNLKQVGTAYRIWNTDSGSSGPSTYPIGQRGWHDYLDQTNGGKYCWTNYVLMESELAQSTLTLTCSADEREPAVDFKHLSNTNISYFVGADAHEEYLECFLSGDRNLSPSLTGKNDYGFSKEGGLGNDVWIKTNSTTDPICWSLKMHSDGDPRGAGNILLGDGSVQQVSSARLRDLQTNAAVARELEPDEKHKTSFRLIFP